MLTVVAEPLQGTTVTAGWRQMSSRTIAICRRQRPIAAHVTLFDKQGDVLLCRNAPKWQKMKPCCLGRHAHFHPHLGSQPACQSPERPDIRNTAEVNRSRSSCRVVLGVQVTPRIQMLTGFVESASLTIAIAS